MFIAWKIRNGPHYISCRNDDGMEYGFHANYRTLLTDSWSYFPGSKRTIINRELRIKRKYAKARRLYGDSRLSSFGVQIAFNLKRTK